MDKDGLTLDQVLGVFDSLTNEAEAQLEQGWGEEGYVGSSVGKKLATRPSRVSTYDNGYVEQPVYACKTCSAASGITVCLRYGFVIPLTQSVWRLFWLWFKLPLGPRH